MSDIAALVKKVQNVHQAISDLAREDLGGQLVPIIHRPGWTTIAEYALVEASLESLRTHIEAARAHCRQLKEAAGKVGDSQPINQVARSAVRDVAMDITKVFRVSVKRFNFVMKAIAEADLWDEAELRLEDHGCVEIVVSSEPITVIQKLLRDKIQAGESSSPRVRGVALCACGAGMPGPVRPVTPPSHGGGGDAGGGGDGGDQ
jgi:hypothetical protein